MHRDELLGADLLSEIVLIVTGTVLLIALLLVLVAVSTGSLISLAG